jgi:hypothetical protein
MAHTMAPIPPFHRLLSFYSNRSQTPDTQTITLRDSLTGNLALGLDFPVALAIALGRHLYLKNTGWFSLNVFIPNVKTRETLLEGLRIDEKKEYSAGEMWEVGAPNGIAGRIDAVGVWALAADVRTGRVSGSDVQEFQQGTLFQRIEARRKTRDQILPLWRGGPLSSVGHSYVVDKLFAVKVYRDDWKED